MKTLVFAALAALASKANAECANACSGHGECGTKDQCICYDNFFGSDCSLQRCPSALAFVDVPNGDLNHDGALGRGSTPADYLLAYSTASEAALKFGYSKVQWSRYLQPEYWPLSKASNTPSAANNYQADGGAYVAGSGEAHWYAECSGKGVCDRSSGECACYDGYTGSACQRTTCPNDCSGHGVCRTVKDIAAVAYNKKFVDSAAGVNTFSGVQDAFEYRLYDGDKNAACVCDSGYGGVDCSLRECPRGDDPLTAVDATCGGEACKDEVQHFALSSSAAGSKYYINFKDFNGNVWKTSTFTVAATSADEATIKAALQSLPNSLVGKVTVASDFSYYGLARYLVTFNSISGNIPEFEVKRVSGLDPVIQPSEPVQTLDLGAGNPISGAGNTLIYVDPVSKQNYRDTQLKTSAAVAVSTVAHLESAFAGVGALTYELGSSPVSVVHQGTTSTSTTATKFLVIFKNNPNRPSAAKNLGYNKIRASVNSVGMKYGVKDAWDGNKEYSICSNRGMCDYSTGLCACFGGYTGAACDTQSALAQ